MIASDFTLKYSYWIEFVEEFNTDICASKFIYADNKPLFINDNDDFNFDRGNNHIILYHHIETKLDDVGLQIWNSSIVMADWIINEKHLFAECNIIELGSGIGLLSILMSNYCKEVYVTDYNPQVLQLCEFNVKHNSVSNAKVKLFDWTSNIADNFLSKLSKYNLNKMDENFFNKIDYIIASDVIYDDDLTESFMRTIYQLLLTNLTAKAIIFVQKRIICSYSNEECSPHFDHFMECLNQLNGYEEEIKNVKFEIDKIKVENISQYFQYESRPSHVFAFQISTSDLDSYKI